MYSKKIYIMKKKEMKEIKKKSFQIQFALKSIVKVVDWSLKHIANADVNMQYNKKKPERSGKCSLVKMSPLKNLWGTWSQHKQSHKKKNKSIYLYIEIVVFVVICY